MAALAGDVLAGRTLSDLWYAYVDQPAVGVDDADAPDDDPIPQGEGNTVLN